MGSRFGRSSLSARREGAPRSGRCGRVTIGLGALKFFWRLALRLPEPVAGRLAPLMARRGLSADPTSLSFLQREMLRADPRRARTALWRRYARELRRGHAFGEAAEIEGVLWRRARSSEGLRRLAVSLGREAASRESARPDFGRGELELAMEVELWGEMTRAERDWAEAIFMEAANAGLAEQRARLDRPAPEPKLGSAPLSVLALRRALPAEAPAVLTGVRRAQGLEAALRGARSLIPEALTREDAALALFLALSRAPGAEAFALEAAALCPPERLDGFAKRKQAEALYRCGWLDQAQALLKEAGGGAEAAAAMKRNQAYLDLLERGWPTPPRLKRARRKGGRRVGVLLHNSLPYDAGGYANRSQGLLGALARDHGWEIHAITRPGYPEDRHDLERISALRGRDGEIGGVIHHRLAGFAGPKPTHELMIAGCARALEAKARELDLDLLHGVSNYVNGLAATTAARRLGLPSVYELRGLWEITRLSREPQWGETQSFQTHRRLEAQAFSEADGSVALSGALLREMEARGATPERVLLLPNGVDAGRFRPRGRDEALAGRLGLLGKIVIGYVGSVTSYEGLDDLAAAIGMLPEETRGRIGLLIVGTGDYLGEARQAALRAGIMGLTHWAGRVSPAEVEAYYSLIDICPFPRKPLPVCEMVTALKPFEAMAMGKAVLASDVAALAEAISPQKGNGLVFQKGDLGSLAEALALLIGDEALRRRLGAGARRFVEAERDWSRLSGGLSELYAQLLEG